jgi:magnesium transporter
MGLGAMLGKLLLPEIREFLESRRLRELKEALAGMADVEIAELIDDLTADEKGVLFRLLSLKKAIEVFEDLSIESQESLVHSLANERVAELLEEMAPDERTALLEDLPSRVTRRLLTLLSPEERLVATSLLGYPEDSAGRLMTPDLVWIREDFSAAQALEKIREIHLEAETVNICYVVDAEHRLRGDVTLAALVLAPSDRPVAELMTESSAAVTTDTDREEAAILCAKYDILAVPVTKTNGKLVGIVTVDDLVDVIAEEATEDIHVMAGVLPPERPYLDLAIRELWWRRVVWLVGLVLIQLVAGVVLHQNIDMLQGATTLALFITVLTATGGSCGTQSATMVIRAIATGDLQLADFRRAMIREVWIGLLLGLVLGLLVFALACVVQWGHLNWGVSLTVGISLGVLLAVANLVGALLPLLFNRFGLDPALMAGPVITTIVDVFGLLLYFGAARLILAPLFAGGI